MPVSFYPVLEILQLKFRFGGNNVFSLRRCVGVRYRPLAVPSLVEKFFEKVKIEMVFEGGP